MDAWVCLRLGDRLGARGRGWRWDMRGGEGWCVAEWGVGDSLGRGKKRKEETVTVEDLLRR